MTLRSLGSEQLLLNGLRTEQSLSAAAFSGSDQGGAGVAATPAPELLWHRIVAQRDARSVPP